MKKEIPLGGRETSFFLKRRDKSGSILLTGFEPLRYLIVLGDRDLIQVGVNVTVSSGTPVKKNRQSPSGQRAGSARPSQRAPTLCTNLSNGTPLCFGI